MLAGSEFPPRYLPLEQLGKGGGGEVWSARDRVTGRVVALKLLREGADEPEILALVREATALSGIEGLGVPQVLHFGRLPESNRAYMVRELVRGQSLADLLDRPGPKDERTRQALAAVAQVADLLTRLHRALLLHGDIKPANIIVGEDGRATLVDLGLAAHWREGGTTPKGLTPRYAAPELFCGEPLTPRAEVFALGATVDEVLKAGRSALDVEVSEAVAEVVARATAELPADRFPSADEFGEALRRAARLEGQADLLPGRVWSIVGLDDPATELMARILQMGEGGGLVVVGPDGSGRTTLLRRISWSLGVRGTAIAFLESPSSDEPQAPLGSSGSQRHAPESDSATETPASQPAPSVGDLRQALEHVTQGRQPDELVLVVDDADQRSAAELEHLGALRRRGATLVTVVSSSPGAAALPEPTFELYEMPALDEKTAAWLVRRMIPSLSDRLVAHIVARTGGRPGVIRTVVSRLEGVAVVSIEDLEQRLSEVVDRHDATANPAELHRLLDRGRFEQAAQRLERYADDGSLAMELARAKLAIGQGNPRGALDKLQAIQSSLEEETDGDLVALWHLQMARALLRVGDYDQAETQANLALAQVGVTLLDGLQEGVAAGLREMAHGATVGAMVAEALAVSGLAQSFAAKHDDAIRTLRRSVEVARGCSQQGMAATALASLAVALQRRDDLDEAEQAYREALDLAEQAGDAGMVATTRQNLAGIAKLRGDIAGALAHYEAAVDMGRRSGRTSTVQYALLNLANLDLYLGRHARARAAIDALAAERDSLGQIAQAQLLALEAEQAAISGELAAAGDACLECAVAYEKLGRSIDAAEARLERVVWLARAEAEDAESLEREIERAEQLLEDSGAHRALLAHARGHVIRNRGKPERALMAFGDAIEAGQGSGQREWVWRALQMRSELRAAAGDSAAAEQDRRAALAVLEEIASELPRDLREVYWNDPRRRALQKPAATKLAAGQPRTTIVPSSTESGASATAQTQLGAPVREDRLARVLEINREIAGEYDLDRLLDKVTDHAIALLSAERGFVLLRSRTGEDRLSIHAARDRDGADPHARFSQSIAERVVATGDPFVAVDAGQDDRVSDYVSVHQLMLKSVACVPIRARSTQVIGALYLETRMRPAALFDEEIPTLTALADQVAIAIETARLVGENLQRAAELEEANRELEAARVKLKATLGRRTEQLASTRRNLRSARQVIHSHFGYRGIVGKSEAMRRVFAIVDRVKDTDVPVLLTGESGTGKEVIARAIHKAGPRSKQRFVGINCGAIPEHLLESELFGHVRGAFTGADRDSRGLFRELTDGTILLDEIGEMPQKMQAGLLRVLQEKVVRPVGGTKEERVDTRVVTATHRNLEEMVATGAFREDLYYRLNVIEIRVPPLRERIDDIPLLIDHFLRLFAARYNRPKRPVSREAVKRLMGLAWPGNVRQLENVLLNAWILSDREELELDDFELPHDPAPAAARPAAKAAQPASLDERTEQEREQILAALTECGWNRARAAKLIGMPRRTFYRRLKKYGIQ